MNIFEKLKKKNICYAVMRSKISFGEMRGDDYCIIAHSRDTYKVRGLYFIAIPKDRKIRQDCDYPILERTLDLKEIKAFHKLKDNFVKSSSSEFGDVYEMKNNSFKSYYYKRI